MSIAANIGDLAFLEFPACFPDSIVRVFPKSKSILITFITISNP